MKVNIAYIVVLLALLLGSCRCVEKYYVRNESKGNVTVYATPNMSRDDVSRIMVHQGEVLNIIGVTDVPYTVKPVIGDSMGYYAIVVPPESVAFLGEKSKKYRSMHKVKFLQAGGRDILFTRQEAFRFYIYYADFK